MSPRAKQRRNERQASAPSGLPLRQLRTVLGVAFAFGVVTAAVLSWELLFPASPETLVETVWTHECRCALGWINTLRSEGFTVRDFEMEDLVATRRQWHVPNAATGCHPARYMGYILDGHISAETLRRLARERPAAVAVIQIEGPTPDARAASAQPHFELIDRDGKRHPWT